jgi:hypothetical protein
MMLHLQGKMTLEIWDDMESKDVALNPELKRTSWFKVGGPPSQYSRCRWPAGDRALTFWVCCCCSHVQRGAPGRCPQAVQRRRIVG